MSILELAIVGWITGVCMRHPGHGEIRAAVTINPRTQKAQFDCPICGRGYSARGGEFWSDRQFVIHSLGAVEPERKMTGEQAEAVAWMREAGDVFEVHIELDGDVHFLHMRKPIPGKHGDGYEGWIKPNGQRVLAS